MTEKQIKIITTVGKIGGLATSALTYLNFLPGGRTVQVAGLVLTLVSSVAKDALMMLNGLWDSTPSGTGVVPAKSPRGSTLGLFFAGLFLCGVSAQAVTVTYTNASGGITTISNAVLVQDSAAPNPIGQAGVIAGQIVSDGYAALKGLNFSEGLSGGAIGLWDGSKSYGFGIEVNTTLTNQPVQAGFGAFALNNGTGRWEFYDATLNISISTTETIPVLGIPVTLKIESGPGMAYNNNSWTAVSQSAAYATYTWDINSKIKLTIGGGTVNISDQPRELYMGLLNFTYLF